MSMPFAVHHVYVKRPNTLDRIHEKLDPEKNIWSSILKKNAQLKILRNILHPKFKRNFTHRHMSVYLTSSDLVSKVSGTPVMEEIDKLSKSLMSSRYKYKLRKLKPRRRMLKLKDSLLSDAGMKHLICKIAAIFKLEKYIGSTNCESILQWTAFVLKMNKPIELPRFVYKEAQFARAFRSKKVMIDEDSSSKRDIQQSIINNVRYALCWWILMAFRQVIVPIKVGKGILFFYKKGYQKILNEAYRDFKRRYKVRMVNTSLLAKSPSSTNIGLMEFLVNKNKLRPIFRAVVGNKKRKFHWKKVNAMLTWCLRRNGIEQLSIKDSCKAVSAFLAKNSQASEIFGYTADLTKCFSAVRHDILLKIVESILREEYDIWLACGKGRNEKGRSFLFFCPGSSKSDAKECLKQKMLSKGVTEYITYYEDRFSSKWLLYEIRGAISSYFFEKGHITYKMTNGVPQGHPLSSNLAHMYLESFENEYWSAEKNNPNLVYCRYEDDYIFVTTDKNIVENVGGSTGHSFFIYAINRVQMLKPLFSGQNRYYLVANREKCKSSESEDRLLWCGVKMDLKNSTFSARRRCRNGTYRRLPMKL